MKTKKFFKKLDLNKRTISNLGQSEMTFAKGGESEDTICYPGWTEECIITMYNPANGANATCYGFTCGWDETVPAGPCQHPVDPNNTASCLQC